MEKDAGKRGPGQPPKGFNRRVPVDLNDAIVLAIDERRREGETRADFIRDAIMREIEARRG